MASQATDINDTGLVVGRWVTATGETRGFTWTAAAGMRDLGPVAGFQHTEATAVNLRGDIVGTGRTPGGLLRGLIWSPTGRARELGALPGTTESIA